MKLTPSKIFDVLLGILGLGTVGLLIGIFMGDGWLPVALAAGTLLGAGVGLVGGRGFFLSIFIGTILGGLLALGLSGTEAVTVGAASGAAMGGFLGIWISMLIETWQQRNQNLPESNIKHHGPLQP
ncbi:hypothetical protein [Candidatus Nitrospira neomarina]|uniref:Uncharacterized protein n=1 Tax=Candidatus Nitrospira neomarina TaxID=3020899 RepID=A0AA96GG16_9BACT|nr:hypothetical protein [Candidatus Nitrospira neomarina]WNM60347.1 hypothetical protein PQG83_11290 [Candidatus Nitrospira neomarina]